MDPASTQEVQTDEAISCAQAAREANGQISYKQLWRLIRRGEVKASQPGGKTGHYRIRRAELKRVLAPVPPTPEPTQEKN